MILRAGLGDTEMEESGTAPPGWEWQDSSHIYKAVLLRKSFISSVQASFLLHTAPSRQVSEIWHLGELFHGVLFYIHFHFMGVKSASGLLFLIDILLCHIITNVVKQLTVIIWALQALKMEGISTVQIRKTAS